MSIPIVTKVRVLSKWTNEGKDKDGNPKIYYNIKVADTATYDTQTIGVPEDVFNKAEENKDIKLIGKIGGLKEKYWYFNAIDPR